VKPAILICGQTGTGKSSIVNFRLRKPAAKVGNAAESVRNGFPPPRYENDSVIFYDSDGYEIGKTEEYRQKLAAFLAQKNGMSGVHLVWYTINAAAKRVTPFDKEIVGLISEDFPVAILLTKIDDCDEEGLHTFLGAVSDFIPEANVFAVSAINGEIQKYTDWNALVEWTTETLNTVEVALKLRELAQKAYSVIENTRVASGLSAAIPIPLLDTAAFIPVLSAMVSKILAVYGLSLNDNVVIHVIKSMWGQLLGKTAVSSGLKLLPVVGWIASAAAGGAVNVMIANSLGEATIGICNDFLFDELTGKESRRNFADIFTSDGFTRAVEKHMKEDSNVRQIAFGH
jgi:uncharacterized protein (DUF697 family)/GTP-binding protein EngB required for normal cell division